MKARGTWVLMFFIASAMIVAVTLNFAFRDIFAWAQIDNFAILGDAFRLSTLCGASISLVLTVFFGVFYRKSRQYIDQCVVEFYKVAFPEWRDTKVSTFIVVLVAIVASLILGVFDSVFSWLTENNLFIW